MVQFQGPFWTLGLEDRTQKQIQVLSGPFCHFNRLGQCCVHLRAGPPRDAGGVRGARVQPSARQPRPGPGGQGHPRCALPHLHPILALLRAHPARLRQVLITLVTLSES